MSPPLYHVSDSANERMEKLHFSCPEPRTYKMKNGSLILIRHLKHDPLEIILIVLKKHSYQ